MKSLEDRLSQEVEGDSLAVDLAKGTLNRNAFAREEELRRFPCRYIESVKSPDEHVLWSICDIREAFRAHFRDRFARLPESPDTGVSQLFSRLPPPSGGRSGWLRWLGYIM